MRRNFVKYILALFAFVGCRNEIVYQSAYDAVPELIYVYPELLDNSKTALGEDNDILWKEGDRISVFNHRSFNDEYLLREGYGGKAAGEFKRIPSMVDDMQQIVQLTHSVAYYPYLSLLTCRTSGDGYILEGYEMPSIQYWMSDSFDKDAFPMVAVSESQESFSFRNLCGVLKLCFTGTMSVKQIVLTGHNEEALAGTAVIYAYPGEDVPDIKLQEDAQNAVVLDCGEGVCLDPFTATEFMFVLPPVDFCKGFDIQIECEQGRILNVSTDKSNPVSRSMILRMPVIDLDELVAQEQEEVIVFEDPLVEERFISEYDSNSDKSISVSEAAAVKSLGSFFFGEDAGSIRSLNDLKYFTSLSVLADDAFNGCKLLESVTLPESLKEIGKRVFADCATLSEVVLNDGLEYIGTEAFRSCYNLFEIHIPSSLENIGEGAFKDCINIEKFSGTAVASDGRSLLDGDVLVAYAFSGQGRFSYEVPSSVVRIGDCAFYNCRNIQSISSHQGLQSIGNEAFFGCGLLSSVEMARGVEKIGDKAFARCYSLREITLPETVGKIGNLVFSEQTSLQKLFVDAKAPPVIDGVLFDEIPEDLVIYVPASSLPLYLSADVWSGMRYYIQASGDDEDDSDDYADDGKVTCLQKASEGKGINLILMGDAFSATDISDGTYKSYMDQAMDAFFSVEPYLSYRDLFNVYSVDVVSSRSGYDYGTGKLETFFGEGTHVGGNDQIVMQYAMEVLTQDQMDDALIIVLMNRKYYAGTCYMYYHFDGDYGRGLSIAYFPLGEDDLVFEQLLHHEAGGHGFAKLYDEYSYDGYITSEEEANIEMMSPYGWAKNVDLTSDWYDVKWSRFLFDTRYKYEGLGVYEGACTYRYGVYRPSRNSIMNDNTGGFNAPSREAIWYRIHKLAYGEYWEYDYEEFVRNDTDGISAAYLTRSDNLSLPKLGPPVVRGCSWRDYMDKNQ